MCREFSASANDTLTTASGIKYVLIQKGDGVHPNSHQLVSIMYCIKSPEGEIIDSNQMHDPFRFRVDNTHVIDGLNEIVKQMSIGESIYCIIPSELGHGEKGIKGDVAPNTTLSYYIQLLAIK
ncbi:FKBP-type peptidyl-prolyl cis-trans isomerase [Cytophaga hutchinsonii]|nr:FKBP-type peptidyl-prolyl cis-trans isomerase [Cytophaga hutchinsonii]